MVTFGDLEGVGEYWFFGSHLGLGLAFDGLLGGNAVVVGSEVWVLGVHSAGSRGLWESLRVVDYLCL